MKREFDLNKRESNEIVAVPLNSFDPTNEIYAAQQVDQLIQESSNELSNYIEKTSDELEEALQFKEWFPGGEAKSIEDCTSNLKYDWENADSVNHTVEVLPFRNTGDSDADNSDKVGRVVIPPYVDHEGARFKVSGVVAAYNMNDYNNNLTFIVAPTTITSIGVAAFFGCTSLASVSLPAATSIGDAVFYDCNSLASVSLPAATSIGNEAFHGCASLVSVLLPAATTIEFNAFLDCNSLVSVLLPAATSIGNEAFYNGTSLSFVDFGPTARQSVPTLGTDAFPDLSQSGHTCRIIVPDANYDAWTEDTNWAVLMSMGYEFLHHSEWEYAHRYETQLTPVYSDTPTFSEWVLHGNTGGYDEIFGPTYMSDGWVYSRGPYDSQLLDTEEEALYAQYLIFDDNVTATRTRTDIIGYQLGSQSDKTLQPKGDYAFVADATLMERGPNHDGFSEWTIDGPDTYITGVSWDDREECWYFITEEGGREDPDGQERFDRNAVVLEYVGAEEYTATRMMLPGYVLGNQTEKPIPKLSDVPAVVSPSTDAEDKGKAADAKETGDALSTKVNSTALAAPFSASTAYPANSYVTHDGLMYKCTSSIAAGEWDATKWTQVDLMTPDATFDVLADGRLRISDSSGNELWSQGYGLASASIQTLFCDKVNYYAFAATNYEPFSTESTYALDAIITYNDKVYTCTTAVETAGAWTGSSNWTETPVSQEFTLPRAGSGKVGDFILDVSNENNVAHEVNISLSGTLGTDYDIIVPIGESISNILVVPGGRLAEFYFTMTAFGSTSKPAWKVVRQLVEMEEITS